MGANGQLQAVTLVARGGTPVTLCDAFGNPIPTTGSGALVFNQSPLLVNPEIDNSTTIPPVAWAINSSADFATLATRPSVVTTLGYVTPGDGGGGDWAWVPGDTTPVNGGTVVSPFGPPTGRYKRIYYGAVSVRWFGAKLDGVTDDTAAVQAALNLGGALFIDGPCLVSSVTANLAKTSILGAGANAQLISKAGSTGTTLNLWADDCRVEGLTFMALNSPALQYQLWISGDRYRILHCRFYGQDWSYLTPSVVAAPVRSINVQNKTGTPPAAFVDGIMDDIYVSGGLNGINVTGARHCKFDHITTVNCMAYGMGLGQTATYENQVDNFTAIGCGVYGFSVGGPQNTSPAVEAVPLIAQQFTNMYAANCGWGRYFASINGNVGVKTLGFDYVCTNQYGTSFKGVARDCAGGGMETKCGTSAYAYTGVTNNSTPSGGTVLSFASVNPLINKGYLVSGTNIAPDTYVAATPTAPFTTITLTRPTIGTVASGATINFSPNINPRGNNDSDYDLLCIAHTADQTGFFLLMEDTTVSGFTRNQYARVHMIQEQAIPWKSGTLTRKFDIVSDGGLLWVAMTAGTTGLNFPSQVTPGVVQVVASGTLINGSSIPVIDSTGVTPGMPIVGSNIPAGATVTSVPDGTHVNISPALVTPGVLAGYVMSCGPVNGDVILTIGAGNVIGTTNILVANSAGAVQGMTVWVDAGLPDGTTITGVPDSTHITVSTPLTAPLTAGLSIVCATVVNDGGVIWACQGADTTSTITAGQGCTALTTYGCRDSVVDVNSEGCAYALNINTTSGSDNIYNGIKARVKAVGAYIGVNITAGGTLTNCVLSDCDVEAWQSALTMGPTASDVTILGGRWKTTHPAASQYALRINAGTNSIRIDGGAYFLSGINALLVVGGTNTIRCGAATFEGASISGIPISITGGAGTIDWGNAICQSNNAAVGNAGFRITGGTMTTRGRLLRTDLSTAPGVTRAASPGEYMALAVPTTTEWGYFCQASDFITPSYTWKKLALT